MNLKDYKNYYKRTEAENIHWEIFKETTDYKNYSLGIAQGLFIVYQIFNQLKDKYNIIDIEEVIQVIKKCGSDTGNNIIDEYFLRLLEKLND